MSAPKLALVTGASSGIGQGIALVLARHGYDVAIAYGKNEEGARDTRTAIEAMGRRCPLYQAPLEEEGAAEALVREAHAALGGLSLLVNNAGRDIRTSVLTATRADLDLIYRTNFVAYTMGAGEAARLMVRDKVAGSIIFITSTRGESPHADDFLYGGMKAAVARAAQSMAIDLAPYGIRVNCIAPGATHVRDRKLPDGFVPGDEINGKPFWPVEDAIPLDRQGTPEENGELVAFLASPHATYITGTTIRVDGGLSLPGAAEGFAPPSWIDPAWVRRHKERLED